MHIISDGKHRITSSPLSRIVVKMTIVVHSGSGGGGELVIVVNFELYYHLELYELLTQ